MNKEEIKKELKRFYHYHITDGLMNLSNERLIQLDNYIETYLPSIEPEPESDEKKPFIYNPKKNWEHDYDQENGHYMNMCIKCNSIFFGHKRRVVCKECYFTSIADTDIKHDKGIEEEIKNEYSYFDLLIKEKFESQNRAVQDLTRFNENFKTGYSTAFDDAIIIVKEVIQFIEFIESDQKEIKQCPNCNSENLSDFWMHHYKCKDCNEKFDI